MTDKIREADSSQALKRLTAAWKRSYLRRSGGYPYCGSGSFTGESVDIEGKHAYQEVACQECGRRWRDICSIAGVEEIDS